MSSPLHSHALFALLAFSSICQIARSARPYPEVTVIEIDATSASNSLTQTLQRVNYTTYLPSRYYELYSEHDKNALNWFSVTCGGMHTCAIKRYHDRNIARSAAGNYAHERPDDAPGQLFCWGMSTYGQTNLVRPFGLPNQADCTSESKFQECFDWDDGYRNVSAGFLHTCGILADGRLFCWGNNLHNELGTGDLLDNSTTSQPHCTDPGNPTRSCQTTIKGRWALTPFGGVSAGKHQSCAIRCDENPHPRIMYEDIYSSQGSLPNRWDTVPPSTCTQGEVVCWGKDQLGQTKSGLERVLREHDVDGRVLNDFVSVCAADVHSCAVRRGGALYCWGFDGNHRASIPERLQTRLWTSVRCAGAHTCAMAQPDRFGRSSLECWGFNGHGQTSVPRYRSKVNVERNGSTVPEVRELVYDRSFLTYDTGDFNTCALWEMTEDEQTCDPTSQRSPALNGECWGDGSYSQNNLPARPLNHKPKDICQMMQWKTLATGSYHTCGITIDDAGTTCARDSVCTDYPALGSTQQLLRCPRGTSLQSGEVLDCVPTRTNLLRCWGMDGDGQVSIPNTSTLPAPGPMLALLPAVVSLVLAWLN